MCLLASQYLFFLRFFILETLTKFGLLFSLKFRSSRDCFWNSMKRGVQIRKPSAMLTQSLPWLPCLPTRRLFTRHLKDLISKQRGNTWYEGSIDDCATGEPPNRLVGTQSNTTNCKVVTTENKLMSWLIR